MALRKGKVGGGEPSERRKFTKLHAPAKLDRLPVNCRLFDAWLGALLNHGWFRVERAVAEALRRVQGLVASQNGVDDCLRPVCFGLAGVAR